MSDVTPLSPTGRSDLEPGVEPRWLTSNEQVSWRAFIDAVRLFTAQIDRELQRSNGLNLAYFQILVSLSEAPGWTMRMSELAALTLTSRSRLSHAVARLEANGWVHRHGCPSDKRGSYAVLTDAGFAALTAAARNHVDAVRRNLFDLLSPEQMRDLGQISAVLRDALRAGPVAQCLKAELAADAAPDTDAAPDNDAAPGNDAAPDATNPDGHDDQVADIDPAYLPT